jgi:hypothetical protein
VVVGVIPLPTREKKNLQQPKISRTLSVMSKDLVETVYKVKPAQRYQVAKDKELRVEAPYYQKEQKGQ